MNCRGAVLFQSVPKVKVVEAEVATATAVVEMGSLEAVVKEVVVAATNH